MLILLVKLKMSGLLFLTDDYFKVTSTPKGNVLGTTIRGISLVLFFSTQCKYCHQFIPIFKKLPGTVGGCQFGMINISTNRTVVEKSKNTISPLTYVPYIVLYVNGQPIVSYDGPASENDIRKFVLDMVESLQTKQQFIPNPNQNQNPNRPRPLEDLTENNNIENHIPAYTIGRPKDSDKCYLSWDSAYAS